MILTRRIVACAVCLNILTPALTFSLPAQAVELVRWERIPLPVKLHTGQERIVFVEKNVRVGFPPALNNKLRVQSTGGAVYLTAESDFAQTRLQLQDVETGEMVLLDVSAMPGKAALEPIRVVYTGEVTQQRTHQTVKRQGSPAPGTDASAPEEPGGQRKAKPRYTAPLPVLLTRYAAQNLYAPLRTIEPLPGVQSLSPALPSTLTTLYPSEPLTAKPLAGWRAGEYSVVAVTLRNESGHKVVLDPRRLQGQFVTATFQHQWVDQKGTAEDTTTVYLVMKGKPEDRFVAGAVKRAVLSSKTNGSRQSAVSDRAWGTTP